MCVCVGGVSAKGPSAQVRVGAFASASTRGTVHTRQQQHDVPIGRSLSAGVEEEVGIRGLGLVGLYWRCRGGRCSVRAGVGGSVRVCVQAVGLEYEEEVTTNVECCSAARGAWGWRAWSNGMLQSGHPSLGSAQSSAGRYKTAKPQSVGREQLKADMGRCGLGSSSIAPRIKAKQRRWHQSRCGGCRGAAAAAVAAAVRRGWRC